MNRRTLSGRFSALQSANRTANRQDYFRAVLEPLEDRKMLAVDVMLSNNWVDLLNSGAHLTFGDPVQDAVTTLQFSYGQTGFGNVTNAEDPAHPSNHFLAGDESLHDAVAASPNNGHLQISDGTYAASDVLLGGIAHNHPITVYGDGALTTIVPEVASNHSDVSNLGIAGNGASGAHMAFIINAENTTVSNLTIDGNLGGVGGSMNYQQGVATFYDLSQDGNTGANSSTSYTDMVIGNTVNTYTDLTIGNQHSYSDLTIGNDHSYSDLAIGNHKTYTDLTVDPNIPTSITSPGNPFQPGDAGALLTITGGGPNWTLQTVHIVSVDPTTHIATIAPATGTLGASGGQGFSDSGNKTVTSAATPFNAASVGSTLNITSSGTLQSYTDLKIGNDHNFTDLAIGNTHTYTDLVIDAQTNTNVTSAAVPFTAGDVGSTLTISGGTGFTPGSYTISSVAGQIATLSAAVGTTGSTGGTGSAAGNNKQITSAAVPFVAGDFGATITITSGSGFTPGIYTISTVAGNVATLNAAVGTIGSTSGVGSFAHTKQITSAAFPFSSTDVGATLTITSGTGFTPGSYTITSVSGAVATVNASLGTDASINGVGSKQGFTVQSVTITGVTGVVATVSASLGVNDATAGVGNSFNVKQVTSAGVPFQAGDTGSKLTITDSAHIHTYTADLTIDAVSSSKVTDSGTPFTPGDVGLTLNITGGTNFNVGSYKITGVTGGVATVIGTLGTVGSSGGSGTATAFTPGIYTISSVANNVANLTVSPGLDSTTGGIGSADGGTTKVTSALQPFSSTDVGLILRVTSGAGFNVQDVTITAVNGVVATVSAALGTDGNSGGHATSSGNNTHVTSAANPFTTSQIGLTLSITGGATITSFTDLAIGDHHSYTDLALDQSTSYSDLVLPTTTTATSAAHPFMAADVGATLQITGGTNFTVGTYTITAVNGSNVATLSAAAGTAGASGGTGVGGNNRITSAAIPFTSGDVGSTLTITSGTGFTAGAYVITAVNGIVAQVANPIGVAGSTAGVGSATGGNTKVTSAAHPFGNGNYDPLTNPTGSVGLILQVTSGTGFTPGNYTITAVNSGVATLSSAVGTDGSINGHATTEGFIIQSAVITNVTGSGPTAVATLNKSLGDLGSTGGTGNIAAAFYAAYDYVDAESGGTVTAIEVPLDPAPFGTGNPDVFMTVTNLTVNNTWVHGIALSAYKDTGTYKDLIITNNSVNNVAAVADRAAKTYTDLAIDAVTNTNVTSSLTPFSSSDIGHLLTITGGTGFTPGTYTILSVTSNVATLNNPAGTVSSTGGTGSSGDLNRDGILMMNMDNGFVAGNTVTGVAVGIMDTYYGNSPTFGNVNGPSTHAHVAVNTVTDAVQRAYSITLNHGDNTQGYFTKNTATFSNPNNTAIGVYWNYSEAFIAADTITGAQIGIEIVNTTFDYNSTTGRPVNPLIYAGTKITGPTGSHPNAIGIDMENSNDPNRGQITAFLGEVTITGYPVGVKVAQSPVIAANTYTDLVINSANTISSPGTPFQAANVGQYLTITGGTGFTPQMLRISAVDSTTHIATLVTLDQQGGVGPAVSLGTNGSTSGQGNISHPNMLVVSSAHISGNTVGISLGNNSQLLGGGPYITDPITTSGSAVINPSWTEGFVIGSDSLSIGDEGISTVAVPATADVLNSGNLTLSSTGTFTPLLTGQNQAPTTLFNFNSTPLGADDLPVSGGIYPDQSADQPTPVPTATVGPPYETDTWGGTFLGFWHADMVQNGSGQLVLGGTAVNGSGSAFLFGTIGHKDPNNVGYKGVGTAPLRILDPVDLSNTTSIQIVIKPLSDNAAPQFGVGIIDARGNANLWTFNTPASTSTFTTLTLNLLTPSANLIGPDNSIDLKHIAGFVIGADQGILSGQSSIGTNATESADSSLVAPVTTIPFRFSFDNIAFTSIANSEITVHSTITLGGTLAPALAAGFTPAINQSFVLIQNNTGSPVSGSFSNAPDGGFLNINGMTFQVSYQGNSEHDVTLTRTAALLPVVHPMGTTPFTYTNTWSGAGAVSAVNSTNTSAGATITDGDESNLTSFTASIASPQAHDVLNATASGTVSISGNGTNTLVMTGGSSLADYQATLRTLTYNNTQVGEATPANSPKTINFTAVDPVMATGMASSTIDIVNNSSTVDERFLFYSGSSRYDGTGGPREPLAFSDDNAIAIDKSAYLPGPGAGSPAAFANVSSYVLGINGIMIDLSPGGAHSSISSSDFVFKSGNTTSVDGTWTTLSGANLPTVSVRLGMTGAAQGAGTTSGSDRVELIWASGTAVTQKWLEVDVKATANTGLLTDDHFFFGSEIGDNGASNIATIFKVGAADTTATQTHLVNLGTNQPITNVYDYNRDGSVGSFDVTQDQTHGTTNTTGLKNITIAAGGPFAPPPGSDGTASSSAAPAASGGAAVASSLAAPASSSSPTLPAWLVNRLSNVDLNSGRLATFFEHLAQEDTAKSRTILVKADHIADSLHLDDTLLDSLLVNLGLPDSDA